LVDARRNGTDEFVVIHRNNVQGLKGDKEKMELLHLYFSTWKRIKVWR
jgi:hypothetical protein